MAGSCPGHGVRERPPPAARSIRAEWSSMPWSRTFLTSCWSEGPALSRRGTLIARRDGKLSGELDVSVKLIADERRLHIAGTDGVITETLALVPLLGVAAKDRIEQCQRAGFIDILSVELVHARAVKSRAEIKIVE